MENPATHSELYDVINKALQDIACRDTRICGLSDAATIEQFILEKFVIKNKIVEEMNEI